MYLGKNPVAVFVPVEVQMLTGLMAMTLFIGRD
jgi:hypothetical protein